MGAEAGANHFRLCSIIMFFKFFVLTIFLAYMTLLLALLGRRWFTPRSTHLPRARPSRPEHGPTRETQIELADVEKSFDHPVLKQVSFQVFRGETVAILGRSGSGKSVTLKLIVGLLKPDRGNIFFKGKDITSMDETELLELRKKISYVFQGGAVFDFVNVWENIAYPLREMGRPEPEVRERVDYLLDAVELTHMGNLQKKDLSIGSRKQVAIARAIASDPEVILYDEPTTGLDPLLGKSLSRLIRKLNQQEKLTSIVVTHDLKCTQIVSDRIILFKNGGIHFHGDLKEFESSPDPFVQAFVAGRRYQEEQKPLTA